LVLLNVFEHFPLDNGPLSSVFHSQVDLVRAAHDEALNKLNKLVKKFGIEQVETKVSITSKSARHEILRFAKELAVDLIVVAPHGQGIIGSLGSTATGVINNADCDVLAVRETH